MSRTERKNLKGEPVTLNDRYMRAAEVAKATGVPRSSIYRMMKNQEFPPSHQISEAAVAWLASDIQEFMCLGPVEFKRIYQSQIQALKTEQIAA